MRTGSSGELRLLRAYLVLSSLGMIAMAVSGFTRSSDGVRFEQIDVERINIVEPDGRVRLVLANDQRSPAVVLQGRELTKPGGRPGLIFYNDEGTETGGLIFGGKRVNGEVQAMGHLSFDRYNQDQVIALTYSERGGRHQQGLTILDRPPQSYVEINARRDSILRIPQGPARDSAFEAWALWQGGAPFGAPRLFVGRDREKRSVVDLRDQYGRARLRLSVDSLGAARIEFLDDSGRVVRRVDGAP